MCFSASASFVAGALLIGAGGVAIKKAESSDQFVFACIPIFFGLQQLSEGVLWMTFNNPEFIIWQKSSIYFYMFFAKLFWQIWIPMSIWLMEPDKARKKIIAYFIFLGVLTAIHMTYCLFAYDVSALNEGRHIKYHLTITNINLHRVFYTIAIAAPFFISSLRFMKLLGVTLILAMILSLVFYFYHVLSMWCFFAAILSALVIFIIVKNKKPLNKPSSKPV